MWVEYHDHTDRGDSIEICYAGDLCIELTTNDRHDHESLLELSGPEAVELATNLLVCAEQWRNVQEIIELTKMKG